MSEKSLKMEFDLRTIEHLGVKMYSRIPNALAELIANAYDADAEHVWINLYDENGSEKRIEVIDDGMGMTFDEINDKFLRIGWNRRKREDEPLHTPKGRKVTGKKGLGKLALFGIGTEIEVTTTKKGTTEGVKFTLIWEEIDMKGSQGENYEPAFTPVECDKEASGTTIVLRRLKRKSPLDDAGKLADSLSRLFHLFDQTFIGTVRRNDGEEEEINNERKYSNIDMQFDWPLPDFLGDMESDYSHRNEIHGKILSSRKPLPMKEQRGITLFASGRLVNAPDLFGLYESSNVSSYLTGWLHVDFIDDDDDQLISTNRQSLDWDRRETRELRDFLRQIVSKVSADWRDKRKKEVMDSVTRKTGVDVNKWVTNLPTRDIRAAIEFILGQLMNDGATEGGDKAVQKLHDLVPEHPYYHWRRLHQRVQQASREDYNDKKFYSACKEAVESYISLVEQHSPGSENETPYNLMGRVFGSQRLGEEGHLSVTKKYRGEERVREKTLKGIEDGQMLLSGGVVKGARNPLSHGQNTVLRDIELFKEEDCLDVLSLLSHLFRRLEDAIEAKEESD